MERLTEEERDHLILDMASSICDLTKAIESLVIGLDILVKLITGSNGMAKA